MATAAVGFDIIFLSAKGELCFRATEGGLEDGTSELPSDGSDKLLKDLLGGRDTPPVLLGGGGGMGRDVFVFDASV